ncbi:hypothetical protein Aph01nite_61520 [Acrocarpospora phusangensis]|uniref:Enoyl-CoA hydratase n=1 Tax=Acrocarpospora phusangensis TaxID=1070424 RepID=A0A919URB0_9ACTN|nr:enoyl-CoA hydratase/isomerase family protein [Acrocarpospora phusangensis]GIH27842.1 hypothetical protein Aph01nite_61520 [Acrocarpospora phusangensis]
MTAVGVEGLAVQLAGEIGAGEEALAALPPPEERDPDARARAAEAHRVNRRARTRFLRRHAERVYRELTDDLRIHRTLDDLLGVTAERYPGLVPTPAQITEERSRTQSRKEGREIDQGIFLGEILRLPRAGAHLLAAQQAPTEHALRLLDDFRRTGEAGLETVHLLRRDGVGYLTVHNTRYLNAEDDQLGQDMETAVDLVLLDDAVHVGVVRGGAMTHPRYRDRRVFNSGMNLTHLYNGQISYVGFVLGREVGYINKIFRGGTIAGRPVEKPWVAAVDSFAIGGGMQLLLVFDHVVACDDSYFSLPAVQEGIVPGAANLRLPRLVGGRLARQLLLGGDRIPADDPRARLWCDSVMPADAMEAAVAEAAGRLDSAAVVSNRRMLRLAEEPDTLFQRYLAAFAVEQVQRMYSQDVLERLEMAWVRRHR